MSVPTLLYCHENSIFYDYKYHITLSELGYGEIVFETGKVADLSILVANENPLPLTGYLQLYPESNQNRFIDVPSQKIVEPMQTQVFIGKYVMKYTAIVLKGMACQSATVYFQGHYLQAVRR